MNNNILNLIFDNNAYFSDIIQIIDDTLINLFDSINNEQNLKNTYDKSFYIKGNDLIHLMNNKKQTEFNIYYENNELSNIFEKLPVQCVHKTITIHNEIYLSKQISFSYDNDNIIVNFINKKKSDHIHFNIETSTFNLTYHKNVMGVYSSFFNYTKNPHFEKYLANEFYHLNNDFSLEKYHSIVNDYQIPYHSIQKELQIITEQRQLNLLNNKTNNHKYKKM